jgi:hypothetical protein
MSTRVSEPHRTEDREVRAELERTQAELARELKRSAELEKAAADQKALVAKWTERALKGPRPAFPIPWILGVFAGILIGSLVWWIPVWLSAGSPPAIPWPVTDGGSGRKVLLFLADAGVVGGLLVLGLRRRRPSHPPKQSAQSSNADLTGPP